MNQPEYDVTARRGALVATALYLVVVVMAMWLTRCDTAPPIEEELSQGSILISFGDSEEGAGEVAEPKVDPVVEEPTVEPSPTVEESEIEQLEQPEVEEIVEQPREVNQRALFPGSSTQSSESQGATTPQGVVGTDRGNEHSDSQLGGGLAGDFDLAGRSLVGSLPVPQYDEQQEGRVVINITVDEAGHVTSASLRATNSTTNNSRLIAAAREAALKARFTPSESFVQSGTITYIFKLN